MKYNPLGDSDLQVSELCLGTMTFGQQNTCEDAAQQLDFALSRGVNFIDTAEMYPVPPKAETQGKTEAFVGEWLAQQPRDRLIVATKIAGPSDRLHWIRDGGCRVDRAQVRQAVNDSLKRLKTDYIDLYQIHWPDRYVPLFGGPPYHPDRERETVPIAEQLEAFAELVRAGKIRYLGLSNETPWGVMEFCRLADALNLPRIVSIQNAYSLLNRTFELNLSETCRFCRVGLLAYSPLGFGWLTGKYLESVPPQSRLGSFPHFGQRYDKRNTRDAAAAYVELALQHDLTPAQMALAFVRTRWFVASTIVGATTLEQLEENLDSAALELPAEVLEEIEAIHARYPNPTP